jgi:hypothetical protein
MFLGFNLGSSDSKNAFPPGLLKLEKTIDKFMRNITDGSSPKNSFC